MVTQKNIEGKNEKREIKGNALSFGVMPTLLSIQSGTIEIRTALSATKNTQTDQTKKVNQHSTYLFKKQCSRRKIPKHIQLQGRVIQYNQVNSCSNAPIPRAT